jgi:hypothetical protein
VAEKWADASQAAQAASKSTTDSVPYGTWGQNYERLGDGRPTL